MASICGVLTTSLMVIAVRNLLDMSSVEAKAFTAVKAKMFKSKLKQKASFVITRAAHLHLLLKKKEPIQTHKVLNLNKSIQEFKKYSRKYKNQVNYQVNQIEDVLKEFDTIKSSNSEVLLYMSVLGSMVDKVRKKLSLSEGTAITKVLKRAQEKTGLKNIKNQFILREYVKKFLIF